MTIIICVNVGVYAMCKCARRFNLSTIHIKGLVSQKSGGFSMSMIFVECKLVLPKSREVFIKLPSTECVTIS